MISKNRLTKFSSLSYSLSYLFAAVFAFNQIFLSSHLISHQASKITKNLEISDLPHSHDQKHAENKYSKESQNSYRNYQELPYKNLFDDLCLLCSYAINFGKFLIESSDDFLKIFAIIITINFLRFRLSTLCISTNKSRAPPFFS